MGLYEIARAAEDPKFRARVKAAIFALSSQIIREEEVTPGHFHRFQLAKRLGADPGAHLEPFAWLCASTSPVLESITVDGDVVTVAAPDAALLAVCAGSWNLMAQVPSSIGDIEPAVP